MQTLIKSLEVTLTNKHRNIIKCENTTLIIIYTDKIKSYFRELLIVFYSMFSSQCETNKFLFANLRVKLKLRSGYCLLSPSGYREGYRNI